MRWKLYIAAGTAASAFGVCGCGGSDSGTEAERAQGTTAEEPAAARGDDRALPRALFPRCGVDTFATPTVTRSPHGGWRVVYSYPTRAPRRPAKGQTSVLSLAERPPESTRLRYANARTIRVRGRRVDLTGGQGSWVAQWVTKRARYVAIANGESTAVLRKVIACTP